MATGTAAYEPQTITMLNAVLDQAIAALPQDRRTQARKTQLAAQILSAAAAGERDPIRLHAAALAIGRASQRLSQWPQPAPSVMPGGPTPRPC